MFSILPSVSQLSEHSALTSLTQSYRTRIAREVIETIRQRLRQGEEVDQLVSIDSPAGENYWGALLKHHHRKLSEPGLVPVINATGVVVHTNLGRAPLAAAVVERIHQLAGGYCDLEMDLRSGKRGGRLELVRELLCEMTGAEDAVVVNNNAAATLLAVTATSAGRSVIVSRGELVEIGGSFRVPEVISNGGARLCEVGTTNRTRVSDFEQAVDEHTASVLRVHPSNFQQIGFTERVDRVKLAQLAREKKIVSIEDLGSGLLNVAPEVSVSGWSARLRAEESISLAIEQGIQLVTFSGDKLLGGPQMGCIVGDAELVKACRKHPLYRALRADKLCLAAFEATLLMYREGRASELPIWRFVERSSERCRELATSLLDAIDGQVPAQLVEDVSYVGGGSLPQQALPTVVLRIEVAHPLRVARQLRQQQIPIVVRVVNDGIQLDPRTIFTSDVELVGKTLQRVLQ